MGRLIEAHKQTVLVFNPPNPSLYPDLHVSIVAESALFTTCLYFTMLSVLDKVGHLLSNHHVIASLLQFSFKEIPTLLFLLQINPQGFSAFLYNPLPLWERPCIVSVSHVLIIELQFSFGYILLFLQPLPWSSLYLYLYCGFSPTSWCSNCTRNLSALRRLTRYFQSLL